MDLFKDIGMLGCKPSKVPIDYTHKLGEAIDSPEVDRGRYQRLIGKLTYLSHTRLDIAYVVSILSQFTHAPQEAHLKAAYKTL